MPATFHFTIALNQLRFYAGHGVCDGEELAGSEYLVDALLEFETTEPILALEQTINYAAIYTLVKQRMTQPAGLLETLAQEIAGSVHEADQRVKQATISIRKLNPPIEGFSGTVGVTCKVVF